MAGMVIRAHRFPGRFSKPLPRPISMGVGVFYIRQRRTIDHPQFPVGAKTTSVN